MMHLYKMNQISLNCDLHILIMELILKDLHA